MSMLFQTPTPEVSQLEANLCYAFVDSTRILIVYLLNNHPCTVTELTNKLCATQPKISRHLRILRDLGLVRTTRKGANVIYTLADYRLVEALDILRGVLYSNIAIKANLVSELEVK